jgi:hypothetical protein
MTEVHACCCEDRRMLLGLEQKAEGEPSARSLAEWISFACVIVAGLGDAARQGDRPGSTALPYPLCINPS